MTVMNDADNDDNTNDADEEDGNEDADERRRMIRMSKMAMSRW